jgi:hypothetical protein
MVVSPLIVSKHRFLYSRIDSEGGIVRAFLGLREEVSRKTIMLFTDGDGWTFDGYRLDPGQNQCGSWGQAIQGTHYGGVIRSGREGGARRFGGFLSDVGRTGDPTTWEVSPGPVGIGPGEHSLGSTRWAFRMYPDALSSIAIPRGDDYEVFAPYEEGRILEQGTLAPIGDMFLFDRITLQDGRLHGEILRTDAAGTVEPYLVPPDESVQYLKPAFAGTHIAWFKGLMPRDLNKYAKVELWASRYDADPGNLAPYKVLDYWHTSMTSYYVAGDGLWATFAGTESHDRGDIVVWDLETGTRRVLEMPGGPAAKLMGLTKHELWVLGRADGIQDTVVRFPLH